MRDEEAVVCRGMRRMESLHVMGGTRVGGDMGHTDMRDSDRHRVGIDDSERQWREGREVLIRTDVDLSSGHCY
jgi:hypothetical protein